MSLLSRSMHKNNKYLNGCFVPFFRILKWSLLSQLSFLQGLSPVPFVSAVLLQGSSFVSFVTASFLPGALICLLCHRSMHKNNKDHTGCFLFFPSPVVFVPLTGGRWGRGGIQDKHFFSFLLQSTVHIVVGGGGGYHYVKLYRRLSSN